MLEQAYQSKIIKAIEAAGGHAINGTYSKSGEADLQCGIPVKVHDRTILVHVAIEVKTEKDYLRVMSGIDDDYNLTDSKKLKPHEPLQMAKIRRLRNKGGLALVAFNYRQVLEYIDENIPNK